LANVGTDSMTFDEVEASLPNGFHDAFLLKLSIDYVERRAVMELEVWMGRMGTDDYSQREAYRRGRLLLSGLLLATADVPNREFLPEEANGLPVDVAPAGYDRFTKHGWPDEPLPEGAFLRSFYFTDDADSYLHIAALDVNWIWISEPRTIY
jgi:hypothetical protein